MDLYEELHAKQQSIYAHTTQFWAMITAVVNESLDEKKKPMSIRVARDDPRAQEIMKHVTDEGEALIFWMLENFPVSSTDAVLKAQIKAFYADGFESIPDPTTVEGLREIPAGMVPVAVMRHAITKMRCPFDTIIMDKSFAEFSHVYRTLIML